MNRLITIAKCIGNVLLVVSVVLLLLVTVVMIVMQIGSDGRMMIGNYSFARVVTGSMEPEIPTGSFILIEAVDPSSLSEGDTISFWSDDPSAPTGAPVVHKIVRVEQSTSGEECFITKGTANKVEDEYPVYPRNIIGRKIWQSAFIGALIGVAQAPYMYPILIAILGVCLIINVVTVIKEAKNLSEETNKAAVAAAREQMLKVLQDAEYSAVIPDEAGEEDLSTPESEEP